MRIWTDVQLGLARTRMQELEAEASVARLRATGTTTGTAAGLRAGVGHALIRAGQALSPEPTARHHRGRVAARHP
jgi:hypothetical protein